MSDDKSLIGKKVRAIPGSGFYAKEFGDRIVTLGWHDKGQCVYVPYKEGDTNGYIYDAVKSSFEIINKSPSNIKNKQFR